MNMVDHLIGLIHLHGFGLYCFVCTQVVSLWMLYARVHSHVIRCYRCFIKLALLFIICIGRSHPSYTETWKWVIVYRCIFFVAGISQLCNYVNFPSKNSEINCLMDQCDLKNNVKSIIIQEIKFDWFCVEVSTDTSDWFVNCNVFCVLLCYHGLECWIKTTLNFQVCKFASLQLTNVLSVLQVLKLISFTGWKFADKPRGLYQIVWLWECNNNCLLPRSYMEC
jgi:hypothetical protein